MSIRRLAALSDVERQEAEAWLGDCSRNFDDAPLSIRVNRLPSTSSWRVPALCEMVKADLARQWLGGNRLSLETYLEEYPELGNPSDVSVDLIQAEYEVRRIFNSDANLADYARRFPAQIDELRRLIASGHSEFLKKGANAPDAQPQADEQPQPPRRTEPPRRAEAERVGELPEQFGRYRILKRLGAGAMGSVYLAEDTRLKRKVALKVANLGNSENSEIIERFYREAEAAAALDHPLLCKVYDVGEIDNVHYLAMEHIEGTNLADFIAGRKERSQRQVAAIVGKLAVALQVAHANGIVHRDLKPANVMIRATGQKAPVIVDFGLALQLNAKLPRKTSNGQVLGTLHYMPVEQVVGDMAKIGPPCDIYALGVILYELLTGEVPFDAPNGAVLMARIVATQAAPPSSLRPGIDPKLESICLKAMAKEIKDRYASMADFAAALSDYLKAPTTTVSETYDLAPGEEPRSRPSYNQGSDTLVGRFLEKPSVNNSTGSKSDADPKARPGDRPDQTTDEAPTDRTIIAMIAAWIAKSASSLIDYLQESASDRDSARARKASGEQASQGYGRERASQGYGFNSLVGSFFESISLKSKKGTKSEPPPRGRTDGSAATVPEPEADLPRRRLPKIALAAGGLVTLVLGVIIYVKTDNGQIKIAVNGPKIAIKVDGATVSIEGLDEPITLRAGEHEMSVSWRNAEIETRKFVVRRGSNPDLVIEYEPTVIRTPDTPKDGDKKATTSETAKKNESPDESGQTGKMAQVSSKTITNSIGINLTVIPAGEFQMGSSKSEDKFASNAEEPRHLVRITRPFYLGVTEITQGQYKAITGQAPSEIQGADELPVERVSWLDAVAFCNALSTREKLPLYYKIEPAAVTITGGIGYRLPTEAEWEFACRAGSTTVYSFGNDVTQLDDFGWYGRNSGSKGNPVGQKPPNAFGLYDMHGSVFEWCWDPFDANYYKQSPPDDPAGPADGPSRVHRGGGFTHGPESLRSADRHGAEWHFRNLALGFRVGRSLSNSELAGYVTSQVQDKKTDESSAVATATVPPPPPTPDNLLTITNSTGMKLALIPSGEFMMGTSRQEDPGAPAMEMPVHQVRITRPFYMGVNEVTQYQYRAVTGKNPSHFKESDQLPVEQVDWYDAIRFCNELSRRESLESFYEVKGEKVDVRDWKGTGYRLPTEAEWEYAGRAGSTAQFGSEKDATNLAKYAWFNENSNMRSRPVAQKRPNAFGLYDMQGNLWEWCWDAFHPNYYRNSPTDDPTGPSSERTRVDRGGSWRELSSENRMTSRFGLNPTFKVNNLGFRVARYPSE